VFKIDIETCDKCDGAVEVIACINDPAIVKRILDHLADPEKSTPVLHILPAHYHWTSGRTDPD